MRSETREALVALGAEEVFLGGNESIRLDREPFAWLVESGKVEIFAVRSDAQESSRRTHITTVETGAMLFGVRPRQKAMPTFLSRSEEERPNAMLAIGLPDTRLLKIPISALIEISRAPEHVETLCTAIESWLSGLFVKTPRSATPSRFELLVSGEELSLPEGTAARTGSRVVWVRHVDGESLFLGREDLSVVPSASPVPISDETWLVSRSDDTTVSCIGTDFLVRSGAVWESLETFHRLFLSYVDLLVQAAHLEENKRLKRRQDLDRGTLDRAARRLASVLDTEIDDDMAEASQIDSSNPLLTAARWVAQVQGVELDATGPKRRFKNHGHGIAQICNQSRIRHRLVMLRDDWWRRDNGPLLGFLWKDGNADPNTRLQGRPVALLPTSVKSYVLVDPTTEQRLPIDAEVNETLEGEAFMLYPRLPEREIELSDLGRMAVRRRGRDLLNVLLMGVLTGLLALLIPVLTGQIFGTVIPAADRSRLLQMAVALGVAAFATFGFRLTRALAILRLSGKLDGSVQAAIWDRLLALPVVFYKRFTVGDLVARSMGIDQIRTLLLGNILPSFLDAVFSVFSLLLLFYYDWRLALVALSMVFLLLVFTGTMAWLQIRHQREILEKQGRLASLVYGLLQGIQKLRSAGAEARALSLWAGHFGDMRRVVFKAQNLANLQAVFNRTYSILTLLVLFAAMHFWPLIELSVSEFLAFSAAFAQFQAASLGLIGLLSSILGMVPLYERLSPLLKTPPEVDASKTPADRLSGEIELGHVSFRYDENGPLILDDVSIHAEPGEFIALVGPSGSGKSTTLRLLLGFEKPEAGSIYFDGQDLPSLDAHSVRRQIGVVLQSGKPMSGDIFQNLVGNSNLGMQEAWEAAHMAGLAEDIKAMPMGMHTIISEDGKGFSGGQIQRLMIARAVIRRPRILLFDEATSALDNHTQEQVSRSLEGLKATRIVVAHRLSTVRNADRIYVIEKGRVTEQGTYEELMQHGGTFERLASRQLK